MSASFARLLEHGNRQLPACFGRSRARRFLLKLGEAERLRKPRGPPADDEDVDF
jgi:hypothetical protein